MSHTLFLALLWSPAPLPAQVPDVAQAKKVEAIFTKHCKACHGPGGTNEAGIGYLLDRAKLVEKKKIRPGDPDDSRVVLRMKDKSMPPEDVTERPTEAEIAEVVAWIKNGAGDWQAPVVLTRKVRTHQDTVAEIHAHLQTIQPVADRASFRYFDLSNLHNDPQITDEDLRLYRAAVSKTVNHLSWRKNIILPQPLGPDQAVLALDLRAIGWTNVGMWPEILQRYPYGLTFDQVGTPAQQAQARDVTLWSGVTLPFVRADWFVANATRAPLYDHLLYTTLLGLPTALTARQVETKIGIDIEQNFLKGQLARGGFNRSGISGQNRLVERHESPFGAYWKSYDFIEGGGAAGNLSTSPLGPVFPRNPYPRQAFKHDGGEIIFHLPNGLQGYLLVDGTGKRINDGPIEVVSDKTRTSGTAKIVNGLSCMNCHRTGMIDFTDSVRTSGDFGAAVREKVDQLYPAPKEMQKLVDEDRRVFLAALEKAEGPFLRVGADQSKKIEDFKEPIGVVGRRQFLDEVTIREAAAELGVTEAKLAATIMANPKLKSLGLQPLVQGNTVKRATWESRELGQSPYQVAANLLDVGTPEKVLPK